MAIEVSIAVFGLLVIYVTLTMAVFSIILQLVAERLVGSWNRNNHTEDLERGTASMPYPEDHHRYQHRHSGHGYGTSSHLSDDRDAPALVQASRVARWKNLEKEPLLLPPLYVPPTHGASGRGQEQSSGQGGPQDA